MFIENVLHATCQLSIAAEQRMLDPEGCEARPRPNAIPPQPLNRSRVLKTGGFEDFMKTILMRSGISVKSSAETQLTNYGRRGVR